MKWQFPQNTRKATKGVSKQYCFPNTFLERHLIWFDFWFGNLILIFKYSTIKSTNNCWNYPRLELWQVMSSMLLNIEVYINMWKGTQSPTSQILRHVFSLVVLGYRNENVSRANIFSGRQILTVPNGLLALTPIFRPCPEGVLRSTIGIQQKGWVGIRLKFAHVRFRQQGTAWLSEG